MMIRNCFLIASVAFAGAAVGYSAATATTPPADPPQVAVRTGHVLGDGPGATLQPLHVQVGDRVNRLGPPVPPGAGVALVRLDVDGVPVVVTLAVQPGTQDLPAVDELELPPKVEPRQLDAPAVHLG